MRRSLRRWLRIAAAAAGAGLLVIAPARLDRAAAQSDEYPLYFSLDVPLVVPGFTLTEEGTKRNYSGTLRGTLGGIQITESRYAYGTGASPNAGAGAFSMATKAGPVKDGQILMTTDGKRTTVLFFGLYLGARMSFSITGPGDQIGGTGVTVTGLAETNFRTHEQYVAAVRDAAVTLPAAARDSLVAQADQNLRMVKEYQQRTPR